MEFFRDILIDEIEAINKTFDECFFKTSSPECFKYLIELINICEEIYISLTFVGVRETVECVEINIFDAYSNILLDLNHLYNSITYLKGLLFQFYYYYFQQIKIKNIYFASKRSHFLDAKIMKGFDPVIIHGHEDFLLILIQLVCSSMKSIFFCCLYSCF
jgi:hypothetical protein